MRDLFIRSYSSPPSSQDSWLYRIADNFRQLVRPASVFQSSANGTPLHLLRWEKSRQAGCAQRTSLLTHTAILAALVMMAVHPADSPPPKTDVARSIKGVLPVPRAVLDFLRGQNPKPGAGSGGGRIPVPPTNGHPPAVSSIQIVRPSLSPKRDSLVAVPPTILDATAPPVLPPVEKIGLPWMREDTNSPGPGNSNTIGNGGGKTIGDGPFDGPGGVGESSSRFQGGTTLPKCWYCPEPLYTDEAREAKMQGRVMLRVMVGVDGRAEQVQILQGLQMSLDERAAETVRTWKFVPARDAARRAVPVWVTIEVTFRLI